jgi:hypothetical protein
MHSRFAARGRYSWQEASHVDFNRWLVQRYRDRWPGQVPMSRASTQEPLTNASSTKEPS